MAFRGNGTFYMQDAGYKWEFVSGSDPNVMKNCYTSVEHDKNKAWPG